MYLFDLLIMLILIIMIIMVLFSVVRYSWILDPLYKGSEEKEGNNVNNSEPKLIGSLKDGVTSLAWEHSPNPSFIAAGSIGI